MSKNTNIADLINYISVDGSGNVVLTTGGQVATQSYVTTAVSNLVNSAPSTLDTLNELAAALGNDANFATTVTNSIATKLPLSGGTLTGGLSGTSATFTSNVNVGTNIAQLLPITTTNFQILTGCYYDGSNIIATATSGTRIISNAGSFTFNNFTGATIGGSVSDTTRLTIASTGAATFSNRVIATDNDNVNALWAVSNSVNGAGLQIDNSGRASGSRFGILVGNVANGTFSIKDETNNATRFVINSSGNVGIKTTSPTSSLAFGASSYDSNPLVGLEYSQVSGGGRLDLKVQTWGGGTDYGLTTGLTLLTPGFDTKSLRVGINITTPDSLLHIYDSTSSSSKTYTKYSCIDGGDVRVGKAEGLNNNAIFGTWSNNDIQLYTQGNERMRISNVGSVSIGMTSSYYGNVAIKSNGATSYFGLNVYANSNNSFIALNHTGSVGIIETEFASGGAHAPMAFVTAGSERMRITIDGVTQVSNLRTTNLYNEYTKNLSGAYSAGTYYEIVNSSQMTSGIYIIMAYVDTYAIGGGTYYCTYVSVPFFFYTQGTNNGGTVTLPPMIGSGHANMNPPTIRIRLSSGSIGGLTYVEFDPNANWSNVQGVGGATVVFYLKRIGN